MAVDDARRATIVLMAAATISCGPQASDDEGPLGELEYQHRHMPRGGSWYRLERRVEFDPEDDPYSIPMCGMLTPETYDEIEQTIASLDPAADYSDYGHCGWSHAPSGLLHLPGFVHGPFVCDWLCCHPELERIGSIYFLAWRQLGGDPLVLSTGEVLLVADEDEPCE